MQNKRKLIGFTVILSVLLVSIFVTIKYSSMTFDNNIFGEDLVGLGKSLYLDFKNGDINDYTVIDEIELWDETERNKLVNYMKDNNLRIVPGKYVINQGTSFEGALKKFKFESIK